MNNTPLVAINCLAYNQENFIRECLDGFVKQQTHFPFVAIVHDDASTDQTAAIIREYASKYPDIIKPILETENRYSKGDNSLSLIMKQACIKTGAKYMAFCEADDYWTDPLKLQKQVDFLEANPEYSLCYTDLDFYIQKSHTIKSEIFSSHYIPRYASFADFLSQIGYIAPCTWLLKSSMFIKEVGDSADGTFDIALYNFANGKVGFLPEKTTVYRVLEKSASHTTDFFTAFKRQKSIYQIQRHYMESYPNLMTLKQRQITKARVFRVLLPMAWFFDDNELKQEIRTFYKNSLKHKIVMTILETPIIEVIIKKFITIYWGIKHK